LNPEILRWDYGTKIWITTYNLQVPVFTDVNVDFYLLWRPEYKLWRRKLRRFRLLSKR
jgi:hypothetical protein